MVEDMYFEMTHDWVLIAHSSLFSYVILNKVHNLSKPQIPHMLKINSNIYLIESAKIIK